MPGPAFITAVVIIGAVLLISQAAPHRRVKVALSLWLASIAVGTFVLHGSGWTSIISFVLFWALVFAKGIPVAFRTGGGDTTPLTPKA